jgi:hypothetical protein
MINVFVSFKTLPNYFFTIKVYKSYKIVYNEGFINSITQYPWGNPSTK